MNNLLSLIVPHWFCHVSLCHFVIYEFYASKLCFCYASFFLNLFLLFIWLFLVLRPLPSALCQEVTVKVCRSLHVVCRAVHTLPGNSWLWNSVRIIMCLCRLSTQCRETFQPQKYLDIKYSVSHSVQSGFIHFLCRDKAVFHYSWTALLV